MSSASALEFAKLNHDRYLTELKEFLAIPSISTLSENKPDIERAAGWVAGQMRAMGLDNVAVIPTDGHPVVYGECLNAPGKPTLLVYGHYDVQPVDPLGEWTSPPFEPTVRGENIFARGASDMKSQDFAVLKALEAWLKNGGLPINIKVFIEGEEEIGSPNLGAFIDRNQDKLRADLMLNCDSGIMRADLPSLPYGLRGLAYFEVWVYGPGKDLHSGVFGGSVHNPAQALCELIAGMHDANGHITLPGFYDKVRVLSDEERAELAHMPHSDTEWQALTGVPALHGEHEFTTLERIGARPTLEVNGLLSGFTGEGSKTVLPSKAMAKISMRLVPNQDDKEVKHQLEEYLRRNAPATIRWEVKELVSGPAIIVHRETPGMRAAASALQTTFGVEPVFRLEGGSVPVVSMIYDKFGIDSVMMGFGLPDDGIHGPNEKQHLPTLYRGIEAFIHFFEQVAQMH